MRFVIYDNETLEPITVLNLRGFTERDIETHGRRWRVPVPAELNLSRGPITADAPTAEIFRVVELLFEPLWRTSPRGHQQRSWLCFTNQEELVLMLAPDWLPGQRSAIECIQQQNDRLTDILLAFSGH